VRLLQSVQRNAENQIARASSANLFISGRQFHLDMKEWDQRATIKLGPKKLESSAVTAFGYFERLDKGIN